MATPIQIAAMMNTIAAGGIWREPLFLECTLDETTGEPLTALAHRSARRVFSAQTARALRELLASVVTEGTGHEAAPTEGTAAGKTGTAQTGQFAGGKRAEKLLVCRFLSGPEPTLYHCGAAGRPDRPVADQCSHLRAGV